MKAVSTVMACLVVFAMGLTAFGDAADAGKRSRRNAAIGIGLGVATLAIIASSNKARARDYDDDEYRERRYYNRSGGGSYCGRLLRKCNNGSDWACEKYETGGCTE